MVYLNISRSSIYNFFKQIFLWILISLILPGYLFSQSIQVTDLPNPRESGDDWYSILDSSNLLSPGEKVKIQNVLNRLESEKGSQVAIVILDSIGEEDPKKFAVDLFQHWGIGRKGVDDGLLFLMVLNRKIWLFETGYGLEGALPDVTLKRIGESLLVPRLKESNPGEGIFEAMQAITGILLSEADLVNWETPAGEKTFLGVSDEDKDFLFIAGIIFYLVIIIVSIVLWLGHFVQIQEKELNVDERLKDMKKQWKNPWMYTTIILCLPVIPIVFLIFIYILIEIKNGKKHCPECNEHTFELLPSKKSTKYMDKLESILHRLNRIQTNVWLCYNCNHIDKIKGKSNTISSQICPSCNQYTKDSAFRRTLKEATYSDKGLDLYEDFCHYCDFTKSREVSTPVLVRQEETSSYSSSGGTSYSSSSSSSGSGWGGGSSGGGGASGSW